MPQATIREGSQEIEVDGKMFLVNFTHIPSEDWYIGAILDEEIAYQTVEDLKNSSMIYSLIAVILSVVALTVLIRVLMRPLDALNQAIQDVASGQGDLTKRLDTNTDQEFSDLAKASTPLPKTCKIKSFNRKRLVLRLNVVLNSQ